ncbi:MAG TPA: DUF4838 domain-containing protein [Erysipelothrix sp.]
MIDTFIQQEQQRLNINLHYTLTHEAQDQFSYRADHNNLYVKANNKRSVLYALYDYYRNPQAVSERKVARFARRGNIYEVINDTDYLKKQIQWGIEHYHNEIFFTFFLWDEVKNEIEEALIKRDYEVTLGGHSLKYLLADEIDIHEVDNQNISIFKDEKLQATIIDKVLQTCKNSPIIKRISLWPEDLAINTDDGVEFMQNYIKFLSRLQKELVQENLNVEVEHIVYNAGLSWQMLEKPAELKDNAGLNTLFAYWGRDYSQTITNPLDQSQDRANQALQAWLEITPNLTVLEYYSDVFMQSELYPHLTNRIADDLNYYEKAGVSGILNLCVPYFTGKHFEELKSVFDYQQAHQLNNLVYSQLAFDSSYKLSLTENDQKMLDIYEKTLSYLSHYNQQLFPQRLTDVDSKTDPVLRKRIIDDLQICLARLQTLSFEAQTLQNDLELAILILKKYLASWQDK